MSRGEERDVGASRPRAKMVQTRLAHKLDLFGGVFETDVISVVLNHLNVHDGIRLLKTSKSLYYGNVPGSAWIVDKAEEDIAVLKETFEMKHAAREAARAELYRAFAGFGAAWDYYVAMCHECGVAMKTYITLKCDVESNPIRARAALSAGFVADE